MQSPLCIVYALTTYCVSAVALGKHYHVYTTAVLSMSLYESVMQMWNDELAQVAQTYSERCMFEHNPMRDGQAPSYQNVGENIALRAPFTVWGENELRQLMDGWHNERNDYVFPTNMCRPGHVCGHYTQV